MDCAMKHRGFGIYQNSDDEVRACGFKVTVLHPIHMRHTHHCTPMEAREKFNTVNEAFRWVEKYATQNPDEVESAIAFNEVLRENEEKGIDLADTMKEAFHANKIKAAKKTLAFYVNFEDGQL